MNPPSTSTLLAHIPHELICKILETVEDFDDILACAAVCVAWKAEVEALYPSLNLILSSVPLLSNSAKSTLPSFLLVTNKKQLVHKYPDQESCILFNAQTHTFHEIMLPELKGRWFYLSSYGCLLAISFSQTDKAWFLNPFTRAQIELPPPPPYYAIPPYVKDPNRYFAKHYFYEGHKFRVITSTKPWDPNCLFLAIYQRTDKLAFCHRGEKTWIPIHSSRDFKDYCMDAIGYKGEFYILDISANLFRIDIGLSARVKLPIKGCDETYFRNYLVERRVSYFRNYLVELDGHLFLVSRFEGTKMNWEFHNSKEFCVSRLDWDKKEWMEEKSIGNNVILLGEFNSRSVNTINCNAVSLKPNCIYFVNGGIQGKYPTICVYDIGTRKFRGLKSTFTDLKM